MEDIHIKYPITPKSAVKAARKGNWTLTIEDATDLFGEKATKEDVLDRVRKIWRATESPLAEWADRITDVSVNATAVEESDSEDAWFHVIVTLKHESVRKISHCLPLRKKVAEETLRRLKDFPEALPRKLLKLALSVPDLSINEEGWLFTVESFRNPLANLQSWTHDCKPESPLPEFVTEIGTTACGDLYLVDSTGKLYAFDHEENALYLCTTTPSELVELYFHDTETASNPYDLGADEDNPIQYALKESDVDIESLLESTLINNALLPVVHQIAILVRLYDHILDRFECRQNSRETIVLEYLRNVCLKLSMSEEDMVACRKALKEPPSFQSDRLSALEPLFVRQVSDCIAYLKINQDSGKHLCRPEGLCDHTSLGALLLTVLEISESDFADIITVAIIDGYFVSIDFSLAQEKPVGEDEEDKKIGQFEQEWYTKVKMEAFFARPLWTKIRPQHE